MDFLFPSALPLDPKTSPFSISSTLSKSSYPPYPTNPLFTSLISPNFYQLTLQASFLFSFCLFYLIAGQIANSWSKNNGGKDWVKKNKILLALVVAHNLLLAAYSALTFFKMAPDVVDFFSQGWRLAGWQGE